MLLTLFSLPCPFGDSVAPMGLCCSYEALLVVEALIADVEDGARRRQLPQAAQGLTFLESIKI